MARFGRFLNNLKNPDIWGEGNLLFLRAQPYYILWNCLNSCFTNHCSLSTINSHYLILVCGRPKKQDLPSSCSYFFVQGYQSGPARSPQLRGRFLNLLVLMPVTSLFHRVRGLVKKKNPKSLFYFLSPA